MSLERAIIRSPKGAQMQLQCLSQRFTYSIERNILERRGPPRGGSSRSGEGSSQARDRVGQAAHLEDPAGRVVVLGEHARVLEVPFPSNLLKAVQCRPPTGHPRPGLYAALMNGHIDPARFPMP